MALQQALETGTNECKCEIGPHIINLPIAKCEVDNNVGWRTQMSILRSTLPFHCPFTTLSLARLGRSKQVWANLGKVSVIFTSYWQLG